MKKILFIGIVLLGIFLIYLSTLDKKIFYLSLGDELAHGYNEFNQQDYSYSNYIIDYLEKNNILEKYKENKTNKNMRTIDLIRLIEKNEIIDEEKQTIKNALIKSDLITISIGNNDLLSRLSLYKNYSEKQNYEYFDSYLIDLENLLIILRKYCKEDIVFIGYYNLLNDKNLDKYYEYLNLKVSELVKKYDIYYIDLYDSMNNNQYRTNSLYPNKMGYTYIGGKVKEIIESNIIN